MAEPISIQQLKDASLDAKSLSEFVFKPAGFKVTRRLAPTIETLSYYVDGMASFKDGMASFKQEWIESVKDDLGIEPKSLDSLQGIISDTNLTYAEGGYHTVYVGDYVNTRDGKNFIVEAQGSSDYDVKTASGVKLSELYNRPKTGADPSIFGTGKMAGEKEERLQGPHKFKWDNKAAILTKNDAGFNAQRIRPEQIIPYAGGYMLLYNSGANYGGGAYISDGTPALAFSKDLVNWEDGPNNPLLKLAGVDDWTGNRMWPRAMVWDEDNNRWVMFIYGIAEGEGKVGRDKTGLATSADMKDWVLQPTEIINKNTADISSWAGVSDVKGGARVRAVAKFGGKWRAIVEAGKSDLSNQTIGVLEADSLEGPWTGGSWNPVIPNKPTWCNNSTLINHPVLVGDWWYAVISNSSSTLGGFVRSKDWLTWEVLNKSKAAITLDGRAAGPLIPLGESWMLLTGTTYNKDGLVTRKQPLSAFHTHLPPAALETVPKYWDMGDTGKDMAIGEGGPHILLVGKHSRKFGGFFGKIEGRHNWAGANIAFRADVAWQASGNPTAVTTGRLSVKLNYFSTSADNITFKMITCEYEGEVWDAIHLDGIRTPRSYWAHGKSQEGDEITDLKAVTVADVTNITLKAPLSTDREQHLGGLQIGNPKATAKAGELNAMRVLQDGIPVLTALTKESISPQVVKGSLVEIAGKEYLTILDEQDVRGLVVYIGTITGSYPACRITIDGKVIFNSAAGDVRGEVDIGVGEGDTPTVGVFTIPPIRAQESVKIEVFNFAATARKYGYSVIWGRAS